MNANAWAALGMNNTNASRPTDWTSSPQSVSHRVKASCFCQTCICHSSVFFPGSISQPKVCIVPQISLPVIHIQHSIKCGSCGWSLELLRNSGRPFILIIAWVCLGRKYLPVLREKKMQLKKWRKKCCTFAWTNPVFCFVYPLCILLFCPYSTLSLKARAWMDLRGL